MLNKTLWLSLLGTLCLFLGAISIGLFVGEFKWSTVLIILLLVGGGFIKGIEFKSDDIKKEPL